MLQICQTVGLLLCTHTALWWCSVRLPQMFSQIPVWALPKLLPVKPRFVSFGCVLWVLAKTWHFSLETWRFGAKPVCCVALWVKKWGGGELISAEEKQPQSLMLPPPPCFSVSGVLWMICFELQPRKLNLGFVRSQHIFPHALRSLSVHFW